MFFKRIKISGFKSFAEPVEVDILPGLTGVVGPNGCGKSNLVESLRWVMGETSKKSLRSDSMEDVIFGGTSLRAPRELAEVSVVLDNAEGTAPQPYNDKQEIEVGRFIQRGAGSKYQINGGDARLRDVNLFFADLLGGAHSSALVSQGRIEQIILSKPAEKKKILEEAAGITGLYTRRHEAELKLNRAQDNLNIVSDTIKQTENRLKQLEKQAIQANRYRALDAEINRNEGIKCYLRWLKAKDALAQAEQAGSKADSLVNQNNAHAENASQAEQEAEALLAQARQKAIHATSSYEKLENERTLLQSEIQKVAEKISALTQSQDELKADKSHTEKMLADSQAQISALANESQQLELNSANHTASIAAAEQTRTQAQLSLEQAEEKAKAAAQQNANWQAQTLSLHKQLEEAQKRFQTASDEEKEIALQLEQFASFDDESQEVAALKEQTDQAHQKVRTAEENLQGIEKQKQTEEQNERTTLDTLTQARAAASQHQAELAAMGHLFADIGNHPGKAVIDLIRASWFSSRNLEKALAAALGDDLMASLEEGSASFWKENVKREKLAFFFRRKQGDGKASLPDGCQPLSKFIRKPLVLRARLEQTGLVDADKGAKLQKKLKVGQRLVSHEGHLWRWDGFCADPRIAQATQNRLAQWKTFSDMQAKAQEAKKAELHAEAELNKARLRLADISAQVETHKLALSKANETAEANRNLWQQEASKISQASAKKAALDEAARRLKDEKVKAANLQQESQVELDKAQSNNRTKQAEETAQAEALVKREALSTATDALNRAKQAMQKSKERREEITATQKQGEQNLSQHTEQVSVLTQRQKNTEQELTTLASQPAALDDKMKALIETLTQAQKNKEAMTLANQDADKAYQKERQQRQEIEKALTSAKETLASQKAKCEAARQTLAERKTDIKNSFQLEPEGVPSWAELETDSPLPAISDIDQTLEKLERERAHIGAPNLQADEERETLLENYEEMKEEASNLQKAINELRKGITTLNDEGRARLEDAFEIVNENFKKLFKTLFGGGSARLNLVSLNPEEEAKGIDKDIDILEAGLDIVARPPGKAIQSMSLLSGGEKTLTAIALLFAAFKARPAPICVLDEVDAPLDEKNVERFCNLVAEIAASEKTRFLVVTHHSLTLSRMDRLFGVTMEEEGVSRIVSVDLGQAEKLREIPHAAE